MPLITTTGGGSVRGLGRDRGQSVPSTFSGLPFASNAQHRFEVINNAVVATAGSVNLFSVNSDAGLGAGFIASPGVDYPGSTTSGYFTREWIAQSINQNIGGEHSESYWVYLVSSSSGYWFPLGGDNNCVLHMYEQTGNLLTWRVGGEGGLSYGHANLTLQGERAFTGQWQHVVYTHAGSGSTRTCTTYKNGQLAATLAGINYTPGSGLSNIRVGVRNFGSGQFIVQYMDKLTFFNKALSAAEVEDLYAVNG